MKQMFLLATWVCLRVFADDVETKTQTAAEGELETIVTAKKPVTAASEMTVRDRDLKLRPITRPADVLQVTPGLIVVQHAGGGKANQYFLRGYDADHGTDVGIFVDGIPINLVSHGHGQGYADLNWLIPETVERVEVLKGTYFGHLGDFATAGGINLITRQGLPENRASVSGGMFNTLRVTALAAEAVAGVKPFLAVEGYYTDGPFLLPETTRRFSVLGKVSKEFSRYSVLTIGSTAYASQWRASGQIPQREVVAGRLDRFGYIDPNEGGKSHRYSAFANYRYGPPAGRLEASAYFIHSQLDLFSNFTFFSATTPEGDMIHQGDRRNYFGGDIHYGFTEELAGIPTETKVGVQTRRDAIENSLKRAPERVNSLTVTENDIGETSLAFYATNETNWASWFRTVLGLRQDFYWFSVYDRANDSDLGKKNAGIFSPKLSAIFSPAENTDLFLNFGMGFHSNDARGVFSSTDPATPLARVYSYEAGARSKQLNGDLDLAASGFFISSESELVFVGDDGTTEAKGRSERMGLEIEVRYRILSWLYSDLDLTFSRAKFRDLPEGADFVPYAPTRIFSGGITAQHPDGYFGRLGFFHVAERAASEDNFFRTEGYIRFDLNGGYRWKQLELAVGIQNLFNTEWREAQFATTSRLPNETSAAACPAGTRPGDDGSGNFTGCEDINFTPGRPINVQATATYYF